MVQYFTLAFCFIFSFCFSQNTKHEDISFFSTDSTLIIGKIHFPQDIDKGILVISVKPCLVSTLQPESSKEQRFDISLRQDLLKKGITYLEFAGRTDSLWIYDRKYPKSTLFTKSEDLINAIKYVKARKDTRDKKIILLGQSEGGVTSSIVASKLNVDGVILISTPGVKGKEFMKYQRLCQDSLFMETFGTDPKVFEIVTSHYSSKEQNYERSYGGFHQFREETFGPMENIIYQHDTNDSISFHIMRYLKSKWDEQDLSIKDYHGNFKKYCHVHKCFAYIQPEQIALYKWNPELYFPKVKCPVLAVYGTLDKNVEYSSSINNIKAMLSRGGNSQLTTIILKGYSHALINNKRQIDEESINNITTWVSNLNKK